jgi:hypothetical protein
MAYGPFRRKIWSTFSRNSVYALPMKAIRLINVFNPLRTVKDKANGRVRFTLRLAIRSQSVRLGVKSRETHDKRFFFLMDPCSHSPYETFSLTRGWVCLLRPCLAFYQVYVSHTYSMLLEILPFALYTSTLSVQALQSRLCLSYLSHATTAA